MFDLGRWWKDSFILLSLQLREPFIKRSLILGAAHAGFGERQQFKSLNWHRPTFEGNGRKPIRYQPQFIVLKKLFELDEIIFELGRGDLWYARPSIEQVAGGSLPRA